MPDSLTFERFKRAYGATGRDIARQVFARHRQNMRIKKEKTAVANLDKIFTAVFSITYKKGFHAMSMRDLSLKTGMSLGALYAYFESKDQLLAIIQSQGRAMVRIALAEYARAYDHPWDRLCAAIKAHIFLSELFRPWFYFTFMEARNLSPQGFDAVKAMEDQTQQILTKLLSEGEAAGVFRPGNHDLTACMIKALQQEWYLKRWKYTRQNIFVDQFCDHVLAMIGSFCLNPDNQGKTDD